MAKVTLNDISAGYGSTTLLNANMTALETAIENTLSRDGTSPNSMGADLDMNSNKIINLGAPADSNDAARWIDVTDSVELTGQAVPALTGNSQKYLGNDGATLGWKDFYDLTSAESTAMVTPTDYRYPITDPRRFGFLASNTGAQNKTALEAAIAGIEPTSGTPGSGGGTLYFLAGVFTIDHGIDIPDWVQLIGAGNRGTVFKKNTNGDLFTLNDFVKIENIRFDQNSKTGAACYMPAGSLYQRMENCETANSPGTAIAFDVEGGSGFSAINCDFANSGGIMTVASVAVTTGSYTPGGLAYPHHFIACDGSGSTLIDMAGMNNLDITNCRSEGLMCSSGAGNIHVTGCRVGSTGSTLVWEGIDSGQFVGNSIGQDIELSNCDAVWWFSECPGQGIVETGTSAGNHLYVSNLSYTPTWTAASVNPAIGNGTIAASYSREGRKITASIQITMGGTTTYGTGRWRISKPVTTDTRVAVGNAFITDLDTGNRYHAMVFNESTTYWTLFISGGTTSVDATTPITWASGDTLWITVEGWVP